MTKSKAIIDEAVSRMLHGHKPFKGKHYETSFIGGFTRFSEAIACLTAHRINRVLFGDDTHPHALGDLIQMTSAQINGEQDAKVLALLTDLDADGEARFSIQVARKITYVDDHPEEAVSLAVRERIRGDSGKVHQRTIMEADLDYSSKYIGTIGTLFHDDFRSFVAFSQSLMAAALCDWVDEDSEKKFYMDPSYKSLVNADGGLPGAMTAAAVDEYFADTMREIARWAITRIPDIAANQKDRGFIWGEKYLNFNDIDDSCCAIPSDAPGRSAVFHENISLINEYRAYIAWTDTTSDGEASTLSVRMISSYDNIGAIVDAFQTGDIEPTLVVEIPSGNVTTAANFHDTDLLGTFAFYLSVDDRMFVEGEMDEDDRDDCNVHTDFSDYYRSENDEFDTSAADSIQP